jgi:hypothetical protein
LVFDGFIRWICDALAAWPRRRPILSSEGAGFISIPALLCRIDDKDPASTVLRAWARACYIDLPIRYWCRARHVFILRRSA